MTKMKVHALPWHRIDSLILEGASFREPVPGTPTASFFFDANSGLFGFSIQTATDACPVVEPSSIEIRVTGSSRSGWDLHIQSAEHLLFCEFYTFAIEILDHVQNKKMQPADAVDKVWNNWDRLLDRNSILSRDKQLGLIGELWVLSRIASAFGWQAAIEAWHETSQSEHDYSLKLCDLEVKATTNEKRIHVISSITQLAPTNGRPLYLVSIQFTPTSSVVDGSVSLMEIIDGMKKDIFDADLLARFMIRLKKVGWKESHARHYSQKYLYRSKPCLIPIDSCCPRLTPDLLEPLGKILESRLVSVSYRIDVSGMGFEEGTMEFNRVLPPNELGIN